SRDIRDHPRRSFGEWLFGLGSERRGGQSQLERRDGADNFGHCVSALGHRRSRVGRLKILLPGVAVMPRHFALALLLLALPVASVAGQSVAQRSKGSANAPVT